jgi:hypothetical protein
VRSQAHRAPPAAQTARPPATRTAFERISKGRIGFG